MKEKKAALIINNKKMREYLYSPHHSLYLRVAQTRGMFG